MDAIECINSRRSIRKYLSKPVEFEKVLAVIDAAHQAPSAGNLQNWRFVVLTDRSLIASLPPHCLNQDFVAAPVVIVACSANEDIEKHYGIRGGRLYAVQDLAAAIENMLLAAHALGLGACWVGAFDEDKMIELLRIPASARPQALITLGYPDETPAEKQTRSLSDVVYFNKYGMKIKNLPLELRNYSDEIARRTKEAKDAVDQGKAKMFSLKKYLPKTRLPGFRKKGR
jgi:nitroreductase